MAVSCRCPDARPARASLSWRHRVTLFASREAVGVPGTFRGVLPTPLTHDAQLSFLTLQRLFPHDMDLLPRTCCRGIGGCCWVLMSNESRTSGISWGREQAGTWARYVSSTRLCSRHRPNVLLAASTRHVELRETTVAVSSALPAWASRSVLGPCPWRRQQQRR